MATALRKGLMVCAGVAVLGGGLAGMGLANYAQSGAFDFYKQTPPPIEHAMAATADSAGYYPVSRSAVTPPYPEDLTPPRPITIARAAEPADYQRAAQVEPDPPAPVEEQAALPDPDPDARQAGSWTAPAPETPAPDAATTLGETTS